MGAQDLNHGDDEAVEETLSLCDLVISRDANEYWDDDFSKEVSQTATSCSFDHDQDFFEFFSEDFSASAAASAYSGINNNIIFCGKLIPSKGQQEQSIDEKFQSLKSKDNKEVMKNKSSCMFPWKNKSNSFKKSRTFPPSSSAKASKTKSLNKSLSLPVVGENKKAGDEMFDFSDKKVSILSTPVKSRWYFFAFGVGRFPMEIELKDMKMRQSRKNKAMKVQQDGGEPENVRRNKEQTRSVKGLWRLLQVLGWKNKHTIAAV